MSSSRPTYRARRITGRAARGLHLCLSRTAASLNSRRNVRPQDIETPPTGGHATANSEKLTLDVIRF